MARDTARMSSLATGQVERFDRLVTDLSFRLEQTATTVQDAILKPLNAKLGQNCFALAGASGATVNVNFSSSCAEAAIRAKLETTPPAGLLNAPESRAKSILKGARVQA